MGDVIVSIQEFYQGSEAISQNAYNKKIKELCISAAKQGVFSAAKMAEKLVLAFLISIATFVVVAASASLDEDIVCFEDCEMVARFVVSGNPVGVVSLTSAFLLLLLLAWLGLRDGEKERCGKRKRETASSLGFMEKLGILVELVFFSCLVFGVISFVSSAFAEASIVIFSQALLLLFFMLVSAYHSWVKLPRSKRFGNSPVCFLLWLALGFAAAFLLFNSVFSFSGAFLALIVFYEAIWFLLFGVWHFSSDWNLWKSSGRSGSVSLKKPVEWLYSDAWFIFVMLSISVFLLILLFREMMRLASEFLAIAYWVSDYFLW